MKTNFNQIQPTEILKKRASKHCRCVAVQMLSVLALIAAFTTILSSCSTETLKEVEATNRVQEARLITLESGTSSEILALSRQINELRNQLKAVQGRTLNLESRAAQITGEQGSLVANLERSLSNQRKLERTLFKEVEKLNKTRVEKNNDVDKIQLRIAALDKLLNSPIAGLPEKTIEDKAFRKAFFLLINGELDLAASAFKRFAEDHPQSPQYPKALYHQGQTLFLNRQYNQALIPLFVIVDKYPKHKVAPASRWTLARSLEESGELKLAREFYAQLITSNTPYANDATRRLSFMDKIYKSEKK